MRGGLVHAAKELLGFRLACRLARDSSSLGRSDHREVCGLLGRLSVVVKPSPKML
jgi:hypothetical protein